MSINDDDRWKMNAGETSELEKTLTWLRVNTAMTLAALSSTSLLDRYSPSDFDVSQTVFDKMIAGTGFMTVRLENIMRSSQNIAAATSPASITPVQPEKDNIKNMKIMETISPGSSSTVLGTQPRAWVYKETGNVDYNKLAGFVTQHLRTVDTEHIKCAVLTDVGISAWELCDQLQRLKIPASCYDAGVKRFDFSVIPEYQKGGASNRGEAELTAWLRAEAGVLVTNEQQFRGAEADSIIFVTRGWSDKNISRRSPLTRAVAGLLVITSDWHLSVQEMRRHWEVTILEKGAGEGVMGVIVG